MSRVPIHIHTEHFEGPLDLLLYLIQSHEFDISRISLSKITDQYLEYVLMMQELNFEVASEFLVLAATLLYWKSKALLPKDEEATSEIEQDLGPTPDELIRQLLEHQRFLAAGEALAELPRLHEDVFIRPNRKPQIERIWRDMNLTDLALSYQDMVIRQRRSKRILKKETVSVSQVILEWADRLQVGKLTELQSLVQATKPSTVAGFLATLELSKYKKMKLFQEETYASIFVELLESLKDYDPSLHASDFDLTERTGAPADATL